MRMSPFSNISNISSISPKQGKATVMTSSSFILILFCATLAQPLFPPIPYIYFAAQVNLQAQYSKSSKHLYRILYRILNEPKNILLLSASISTSTSQSASHHYRQSWKQNPNDSTATFLLILLPYSTRIFNAYGIAGMVRNLFEIRIISNDICIIQLNNLWILKIQSFVWDEL